MYSASADKFVVRWDCRTGEQDAFAIRLPSVPYSLKLFATNQLLAVGLSNGDMHIFDLSLRKEIKFYKQHQVGLFCIAEDSFNRQLLVADSSGTISVWDTTTLELKIVLPLDCGKIRRMIILEAGKKVVVCAQDGCVRIIDLISFNELHAFFAHKEGATAALPLADGLLLTGGKDAYLKVWDLTIGKCLQSIPAHNYVIYDLISLNETHFASASRDKTIKLWRKHPVEVLQRLDRKENGHKHSVNALVKVGDEHFASCSDDGVVKLWGIHA